MTTNRLLRWALASSFLGSFCVLRAEERSLLNSVETTIPGTMVSGYVDTSAQWGHVPRFLNVLPSFPFPLFIEDKKDDGFNLDAVGVNISGATEHQSFAAGYVIDLMLGPDAADITGGSPIKQAYLDLTVPLGNGLQLKLGRWDAILGYESSERYQNANYTYSYGRTIFPTEYTGLLGAYDFNEMFRLTAGAANMIERSDLNSRAFTSSPSSTKAYMGKLTMTLPASTGIWGGTTFNFGAASAVPKDAITLLSADAATPLIYNRWKLGSPGNRRFSKTKTMVLQSQLTQQCGHSKISR